jgi:GDP-D-mannose 3',5'-epimerase
MVEVYRTPRVADLVRSGHRDIRAVDIKPLSRWYQRSDVAENVVADLRELDAGGR